MTHSTGKTRKRRHGQPRFKFLAGRPQQLWRLWREVDWRCLFAFHRDLRLLERIRAVSPAARIRAGVFVALGLVLTWQIIHAYLTFQSHAADEAALNLDPTDLAVLSGQTDLRPKKPAAGAGQTAESRKIEIERRSADRRNEIRAQAERVLRRNPLNAPALQVLGQLAETAANETSAIAFFQAAARRSLRASYAVYRLMLASFKDKDHAMTAHYADALLRIRPQLVLQATPILARMAEDKDGRIELKKLLIANPPWRPRFLAVLPRGITDARTPLHLLLALRETPTPPTTTDLGHYITFLINHKLYEIAYYCWLQFLPPERIWTVGFLFNGSFESPPSGLPFDWVFKYGSGVTIDVVPRPDDADQQTLFVRFGYGRVEFDGVSQLIMLTPGTYRFEGRYKSDIISRRGLTWRISCAEGTHIGQSAMTTGMTPTWKAFDFTFTVPSRGCRAQYVQLVLDARSASEQLVSGSIWYDELRVLPAETNARRSTLTQRSRTQR